MRSTAPASPTPAFHPAVLPPALAGLQASVGELHWRGLRWDAGGCQIEDLQLRDLQVQTRIERPWQGLGGEAVLLEPLAALEGLLHAFVTDAAWIVDADVRLPIHGGRLDFNRVAVEHVGPNSSLGMSHLGIYLDAPNGRTYLYLFETAPVPGASYERRGPLFGARVGDRGALALAPFVEGVLRHCGGKPLGRSAQRVDDTLGRTRLQGELALGDGRLGTAASHVVLEGRAQGRNRVQVRAAVAAHAIELVIPALAARELVLALPGGHVRGEGLQARVEMRISGLGERRQAAPACTVRVPSLSLRQVQWRPAAANPGSPAAPEAAPTH